ncbi:SRPBCC family protein [Streptomyces sp. NPDC048664]|uniref:SRPBCC family protein n=1 Tax=Streptomyces sp. NPDC048664 TaxID=3154505 RepID=UPI003421D09A
MGVELTGTYTTLQDGRPAVRFDRVYDQPLGRVWRLVTDPDALARWFPSRAEFELRPGGAARFSGDPHMPESTGTVLAVDEPRHLSFAWGGDELRFDLEEPGRARTRLTLTDVLAQGNAAARNAAGWEVCLAALDAVVRGEDSPGPHDGPGTTWKEFYAAYVAAGTPSGAPVPGQET